MSGDVVLRVSGVEKSYGHVRALAGVDLELRRGEVHALIGDNGAGKSTLIKILSGVLAPDGGRIELLGEEVNFSSAADARAAGIETVYQDLALAASFDAGENMFLGREILRRGILGRIGLIDRREMRRRAAAQLRDLGIELPSARTRVAALSGGQRQAVAIGRAAVWGRQILILDEPLAALGARQTGFVLELIRRARDEKGLAVLVILHNLEQVLAIADRITVLHLGRCVLNCEAAAATRERLLAALLGSAGVAA